MKNVIFTHAARQDLLGIWLYVASNNSEKLADRIYDQIAESFARLENFPELGRPRPEIEKGARSLVVARWLVLYRLLGSKVQIVRVIDGARDLESMNWITEKDID